MSTPNTPAFPDVKKMGKVQIVVFLITWKIRIILKEREEAMNIETIKIEVTRQEKINLERKAKEKNTTTDNLIK